jgi:rhodanese-related sulfurtransferase
MRGGYSQAILAALALLLGAAAAVVPEPARAGNAYIMAPDLADRLMRGTTDASTVVLDVRFAAGFNSQHVATARSMPLGELRSGTFAAASGATIVVYGDSEHDALEARALLRRHGHEDVRVLRDGLYGWTAFVLEPRLAVDATAEERRAFERAAVHSRFFGGVPREGMPRIELWPSRTSGTSASAAGRRPAGAVMRRRGCG